MLVIDNGSSKKDLQPKASGSLLATELVGNSIAIRQGDVRQMAMTPYTSITAADGVTPLGATAALTQVAIDALINT